MEGVQAIFSDARAGAFAGEFSFAAESGSRDATVSTGVTRAFFPRFVHGSSATSSHISTSTASSTCTFCFFGVTNGFSCSASSRITNAVRRVARVDVLEVASAERVSFAFAEKRRQERQYYLPCAAVRAELRVRFPSTVEGILEVWKEGAMGGVEIAPGTPMMEEGATRHERETRRRDALSAAAALIVTWSMRLRPKLTESNHLRVDPVSIFQRYNAYQAIKHAKAVGACVRCTAAATLSLHQ